MQPRLVIYSALLAWARLAGIFFLASLKPGTNLRLVLLVSTVILGVGLGLFSQVSYFPVAMVFAAYSRFWAHGTEHRFALPLYRLRATPKCGAG